MLALALIGMHFCIAQELGVSLVENCMQQLKQLKQA
jgi:hypothetical protein